MFNRLIDFIDDHYPTLIFLFFIIICGFILNNRIYKLWYVQSEIVMHDYGQVFETIEDWKLYRLEYLEKQRN